MNRPFSPPRARFAALFLLTLTSCLSLPRHARAADAEPFELLDGDRVAFVGNTFFEREQTHSYLETTLTTRWPNRNVTFRNLGWSGDTVFGHARAYFDQPPQGFERLRRNIEEIKPTVLFVCYGMSESFEGSASLEPFRAGLNTMLDMLKNNAAPNARFVLLSPIRHERLAPPLPDPAEHNRHLRTYSDVIKEVAQQRGARYVEMFDTVIPENTSGEPVKQPLTDNGIHLTDAGYWKAAGVIERELGLPPRGWTVELNATGTETVKGAKVTGVRKEGGKLHFAVEAPLVPAPALPSDAPGALADAFGATRLVTVKGLSAGNWVLHSREEDIVSATAGSAAEWGKGVALAGDVPAVKVERLRNLITSKNIQFFNRYRPANETYIFGFRKGEQGRNAVEIPMFDKPIAELEAEIAKLKKSTPTAYVLARE